MKLPIITLPKCSNLAQILFKINLNNVQTCSLQFRSISDLSHTRFFTSSSSKNTLPRNSGHWKWPTTNIRDPRVRGGNRTWYPPVSTEDDARNLALNLDPTGRKLLMDQLKIIEDKKGNAILDDPSLRLGPAPTNELMKVFLINCLPFIGFGFLDNGIMIIAGEYIDIQLGLWLGISTMAAAALGNLVSDLAGVGTAGYIEGLVEKFSSIQPNLSPAQFHFKSVRWITALGRAIGITIGCLVGMLPLLLFDHHETKEKHQKPQSKQQQQQQDDDTPLSSRRQEVILLNQPIEK